MQMFENVNDKFKIDERKSVRSAMATAIMNGSQERAAEILRIAGGNFMVSGANFTPVKLACDFFNVTSTHFQNVMRKYGISSRKTPSCVLRTSPGYLIEKYSLPNRSRLLLESKKYYEVNDWRPTVFYDPRAVLAFSCLGFLHRKIVPGTTEERVMNILMKSDYHRDALEILAQQKEQEPAEMVEQQPAVQTAQPTESHKPGVKLNEYGEVVIPLEILAEVVKAFILKVAGNN